MEIPEAAIEAAQVANAEAWEEDFPDTQKGIIRSTLRAALPALREQWERERLGIQNELRRKLEWALVWIDNCGEIPLQDMEPEDFEKFQAAQTLLAYVRNRDA